MAEYIKRETAVRAVMAAKWVDGSDGAMAMEIVASPPAADVAPVVRCENCAFSQSDGWVCGGTALMPPHQTFPDSFCECGAKMDGGADHEAD